MPLINLRDELSWGTVGESGRMCRTTNLRKASEAGWLFGWGPSTPAYAAISGIATGGFFFNTTTGTWHRNAGTGAKSAFASSLGDGRTDSIETASWFYRAHNNYYWNAGDDRRMLISRSGYLDLPWATARTNPAWTAEQKAYYTDLYDSEPYWHLDVNFQRSRDHGQAWVSVLSTALRLDEGHLTTTTSGQAPVFDEDYRQVLAGDILRPCLVKHTPTVWPNWREMTLGIEIVRIG